jgi:hypothetical protein
LPVFWYDVATLMSVSPQTFLHQTELVGKEGSEV